MGESKKTIIIAYKPHLQVGYRPPGFVNYLALQQVALAKHELNVISPNPRGEITTSNSVFVCGD